MNEPVSHAIRSCPECGTQTTNVQGLADCPACGWSAAQSALFLTQE